MTASRYRGPVRFEKALTSAGAPDERAAKTEVAINRDVDEVQRDADADGARSTARSFMENLGVESATDGRESKSIVKHLGSRARPAAAKGESNCMSRARPGAARNESVVKH